jgi:hypothetical protein
LPEQPTIQDRERSDQIDNLLDRLRAGPLKAADCRALDQLIGADYDAANARADRLVGAKARRGRNGRSTDKRSRE